MSNEPAPSSLCLRNLGTREVRQRQALAAVAVVAAGWLAWHLGGEPRAWRLLLFLPLWAASLGFLQAREKT